MTNAEAWEVLICFALVIILGTAEEARVKHSQNTAVFHPSLLARRVLLLFAVDEYLSREEVIWLLEW